MIKLKHIVTLVALTFSCALIASTVTIPNTFTANTPAVAAQVNANFNNVKTAVDDNDSKITVNKNDLAALLATVNQLQTDLAAANARITEIENNTVLELDGFLSLGSYDSYDTAVFTSINLQVNDGSGDTNGNVNGLGNIIIGYNEDSSVALEFCSNQQHDNQVDCTNDSGIWAKNVHRGSHNLILGLGNSYDDNSGFVAGKDNVSNNEYASVFNGRYNISNGFATSVSGGLRNNASGSFSNVSGGRFNKTIGDYSAVTGGEYNQAQGGFSSVSGGGGNKATNSHTSVSGGGSNTASGLAASVSGGYLGVASGDYSSITGGGYYDSISQVGYGNTASGDYSVVSGGSENIASGENSSVSGGESNTAIGKHSSVSGGSFRGANGEYDWRAGNLSSDF